MVGFAESPMTIGQQAGQTMGLTGGAFIGNGHLPFYINTGFLTT